MNLDIFLKSIDSAVATAIVSKGRTSGLQAGYQAAFLAITIAIAILSGALTGLILRRFNSVKVFFSDEENWEVPFEKSKEEAELPIRIRSSSHIEIEKV